MMVGSVRFALAVLLVLVCYPVHVMSSNNMIVSFQNFSSIGNTFCQGGSTATLYNHFQSARLTNVSFDPVLGWKMWTKEICDPVSKPIECRDSSYNFEAVRFFAAGSLRSTTGSMCTFCPYHLDPIFDFENKQNTNAGWSEPHPMYGPCLNGESSKRMVCLQHHALMPPKFVGKYHYPKQKALSADIIGAFDELLGGAFPIHQFLTESATASPYTFSPNHERIDGEPSAYGLGKKAVTYWLEKLEFKFTNGTRDAVTTAALRRPYSNVNNVEQWMKYAQFFCTPGCHKYDKSAKIRVRQEDIRNDAELSYLSYYLGNSARNELFACRPCSKYAASYYWDGSGPAHPRLNIISAQCYPWFGAIPSMIAFQDFYIMNKTRTIRSEHEKNHGKIIEPYFDDEVFPIVCPVNTFNRICAHTKENIYSNAMSNDQVLTQYHCTPCPRGYHTGGKTGQWYCLPPSGRLFQNREWLQKEPNAWGDRDYMALYEYPELECGPYEEHCFQCKEYNAEHLLPEIFNEKFIFEQLLSETICEIGFYCPNAYSQIACPLERPWSPQGSGFLSNCTCAAGKYLSSDSVCVPCTSSCQHLPGFYLPETQCMRKNGATADAPCRRCDNLPLERAVADGAGLELRSGVGACPFHCIFGSELDQSNTATSGQSTAEKLFACKRPIARKNANNKYVFLATLSRVDDLDRITYTPATTSNLAYWSIVLSFTEKLKEPWREQPTSCLGGACAASHICYAEDQPAPVVDASIPWYSFAAIVNCTRCPLLPEMPDGAFLRTSHDVLVGKSLCEAPEIFCNSSFYFNRSAWTCQSCSARQSAICPPNTRLRAGGCMNRYTPFNVTVPSADCQACPLDVPDLNSSRGLFFLNYQNESSAAIGGCSRDPCRPLASGFFWSQACGADSVGQQMRCRTSCHPHEFREATCSAYADLRCRNCTLRKAGFQMTENCSLTTDSVWRVCQEGLYCDESGGVVRCPPNKTSLPGARSAAECFCMAGMQESAMGGTCEPYQCDGTVISSTLPGRSLVSAQYMTINPVTKSTICVPCNTNPQSQVLASTRGTGVQVTSCVCPSGFYGVFANNSRLSIQCTECPRNPSCSTRHLPLSCAQGDIQLLPQQPFPCACAIAPFTVPSACSNDFTCMEGFERAVARATNAGFPRVSGSSAYSVNKQSITAASAWMRLLSNSPNSFSNGFSSVQALAISGLMDDSFLGNSEASQISVQSFHYEFVFWIVDDVLTPVVFTAILNPESVNIASTRVLSLQDGIVNSFSTPPKAIGMAASKWRLISESRPYTMENRIPWLYVGVLYRNSEHGLFYLRVRVFNSTNTNPNFVGVWEQTVFNLTLFPSNYNGLPEAVPVAMSYSPQRIGDRTVSVGEGFFFIAFNSVQTISNRTVEQCGGVIIQQVTATAGNVANILNSFCSSPSSATITSMIVTLAQDTKAAYVILGLSSGMVFKIESVNNPQMQDTSLLAPLVGMTHLHNMGLAFSVGSLMYITGISSNTLCENGPHCIRVADGTQMTWVELQGLPWGSASNPWPMSMGVSATSRSEAVLVVSSGPSLFTIPIHRCLSADTYWDGTSCVRHSCIKQTPCNSAQHLIRSAAGICVCRNGFFPGSGASLGCQNCPASRYCEDGVQKICPDGTSTQTTGASSVNQCICPQNGQYFAPGLLSSNTKCISCQAGDMWCPNRWLSFSCPGNPKKLLTPTSGSIPASPIQCQCAAGHTGPGCVFCPDGFYCPDTGTSFATNLAVYYTFAQTPLTERVLSLIRTYFQTYFSVAATRPVNYNRDALHLILYTEVVAVSNRTNFGIMVMIQVEGQATTFTGWPSALQDYLVQQKVNVTGREPSNSVYSASVPVNRPLQCMVSKVPAASGSSCICAPGFETRGEQCSACPVNTFKAASGAGSCVPCPLGRIAPIKAEACVLDSSSSSSTTNQNAGGPDIGLLVGGIGGGVVGLIILIFLMQYMFKHSR